jgi:cell wall-associated NlpC family hydrolase
MLGADRSDATAVNELLPGEGFALLDTGRSWGWGYALADHYVGYVAMAALAEPTAAGAPPATVGPGDGLLFARPDIKAPVLASLPAGARLHLEPADGPFAQVTSGPCAGLYLHDRHAMAPGDDRPRDWVAMARAFTGSPYRWGGRTRHGIDCSGLVQMARMLAGHACRRDSDMQAADAQPVARSEAARGDLAFWPGHVGILVEADRLLHANAHWMACVEEPLAAVEARIAAAGGPAHAHIGRP